MGTDIAKTVARNLCEWMSRTPHLDTVQKVSERSGVGFGTVRRTRNGEGNITIQNLEAIAKAFRKHATDLLREDGNGDQDKLSGGTQTTYSKDEFSGARFFARENTPSRTDLLRLVDRLTDRECDQAIGALGVLFPSSANSPPENDFTAGTGT